jgi:hypothetical protein
MFHLQVLEAVRHQVSQAFERYQIADGSEPRESILLKGGIYCGRRFEVGTGYAMWNAQNDELKIYATNGKVLGVIAGASASVTALRAAA